jgi:cell division protein FtsN
MKNKEFREIQVSSSALVFIFLAILVLGVFIFLLGVSVGKKQAQMAGQTTLLAPRATETLTQQPPVVRKEDESENVTPHPETTALPESQVQEKNVVPFLATPQAQEEKKKTIPPVEAKAAVKTGLFFIQVAAFYDKSQAATMAEKFEKQGYSILVLEPLPTDKKTVYRVRLGGYSTREKASQDLDKLNSASKKKTGYYITRD